RVGRRQHHFQLHILISGRLPGKPAAAQPQLLPALGAGRDGHLYGAAERRHGDRGAERRLPGGDRGGERHVAAVERVEPGRRDVHLEVQVARRAVAGGRLTLTGEPHQLALGDAGGNVDAHRVGAHFHVAVGRDRGTAQLERARRAVESLLELDVDARVVIAGARGTGAGAAAGGERRAAAKERGEEVGEVPLRELAVAARRGAPAA